MFKTLTITSMLVLLPATPAFAGELLQYNKIDEIPDGPGLFSKGSEDGVVLFSTVYSSQSKTSNHAVEDTPTTESGNSGLPEPAPADDEEYQEFLEWQWEQFQQWKQNNESDN
ncbi:MAG: hypothetical protein OER96_13915 [Gammaproteobacteria bacterium]|nr:hypothetical protein [Gammaproteobacteria bacterium]